VFTIRDEKKVNLREYFFGCRWKERPIRLLVSVGFLTIRGSFSESTDMFEFQRFLYTKSPGGLRG
jgi:hypothetical protein